MTLEFVVPTGFSGVIKLKARSSEGIELRPTNQWITLVFPASGELEIKGKLPTLEWHKPVARFADGKSIPIPGPAASVPDDAVALRGLGKKNDNTEAWYLVGRADQMQDAMDQFRGFHFPRR
jgi:hypothetical protein